MLTYRVEPRGGISPGISTCQGCMLDVIFRNMLEIVGQDTVIVVPPGCAASFPGSGAETSLTVPGIQGCLENSAAIASGIAAGYRHLKNNHTKVVVVAGDGGTVDIGLQSLSGAMERNENILYICYDNEAYMNTGAQSSSSTPFAASTSTTPSGKAVGNKDLFQIAIAHRIPYAATASVANISDYRRKLEYANKIDGFKLIHILSPCPTGWGFDSCKTVEIAREAVNCGAWIMCEYKNEKVQINVHPKKLGEVKDYLSLQKRYRGIESSQIRYLSEEIIKRYTILLNREKETS